MYVLLNDMQCNSRNISGLWDNSLIKEKSKLNIKLLYKKAKKLEKQTGEILGKIRQETCEFSEIVITIDMSTSNWPNG